MDVCGVRASAATRERESHRERGRERDE